MAELGDNQQRHQKTLFVCVPMFSIRVILLLLFNKQNKKIVLYFDLLPRYLRGVIKVFGCSQEKIIAGLTLVTGMELRKIIHGEAAVPGYRDLHIRTQELTSVIVKELLPALRGNGWMQLLTQLIGEEPASSYAMKHVADKLIFRQFLAIACGQLHLPAAAPACVVWPDQWPDAWQELVRGKLPKRDFRVISWPPWYVFLSMLCRKLLFLPRMIMIFLSYLVRQGLTANHNPPRQFKIITEFIDPRQLNNTPYDADYWVDGVSVKKTDILFFLTKEQEAIIRENGYNLKNIIEEMNYKGYNMCQLNSLSYPITILQEIFKTIIDCLKQLSRFDRTPLWQVFLLAWSEYLYFSPLFFHYKSDNFIYLTFPSGHSGLRYNTGIITGLCRKNGIRSIGCQTRAYHSLNYEYLFDSFDLYLSWGQAWHQMLGDGMRFIKRIEIVGCIYLDTIYPSYLEKRNTIIGPDPPALQVCIFPSDINLAEDHHYTLQYNLSFLSHCARLAMKHQDINFVIKNKEPHYTEIMLVVSDFRKLCKKTETNFRFIDRNRHDYLDLLVASDVIIAMGFTTPGIEGLLLGKRTIYYNELKYGGEVYAHMPDLIARNYKDLRYLFDKAIQDYKRYAYDNSSLIDSFDIYRDGQTLKRISNILCENTP